MNLNPKKKKKLFSLIAYLEDKLRRLSNERQTHGTRGKRAGAARVESSGHQNLPQLHRG